MSLLALSVVLVLLVPLASTDGGSPLKIFVLAGQSNMVGMASIDHLDILINCSCPYNEYRDTLWNGTAYKAKSNVYMKYDDHHGPLTVGRDTGYAGSHRFGPELMFGWQVGDAMRYDDILLIKTAWGGKTLAVDFRPPLSGEGNYSNTKPVHYGWLYRQMITDVLDTLDNLSAIVPNYNEDVGYELAGLVWFQGWNDMLDESMVREYGLNLANFIRDVRDDLDAPLLPVIVGELGMHGLNPSGHGADRVLAMRALEHAVTMLNDFRNNSLFVGTAQYVVSNATTYNGVYHYWGRADTYFHIGKAFGKGMLQLLGISTTDEDSASGDCMSECEQQQPQTFTERLGSFVWPLVAGA